MLSAKKFPDMHLPHPLTKEGGGDWGSQHEMPLTGASKNQCGMLGHPLMYLVPELTIADVDFPGRRLRLAGLYHVLPSMTSCSDRRYKVRCL